MPDMTPVGAMYQQNPLQSLSSILGIQQQRQQLQLQAQELQRSQVQTQQDVGVNQFFSQVPPDQLHDAQGNISADMAHQRPEYQALPGVARIAVDTKINQLQGQQLQNKTALSQLNGEVVGQFGRMAQSLSTEPDPNVVKQQLTSFAQQGPDQARIAQIYGPVLQKVPPQHLGNALKMMGAQAQDVTAQQAQTNPAQLTVPTGATTQVYNVNKATGLQPGQAPAASIRNTLAPTQQLPYVAAAAAAGAGGTARGSGSGNADIDASNNVAAAQRDARTNIDLTKRIDQLADVVDPGALPAKISQSLGALGLQDVNQARTELQKDLGRLRGGFAQRAGSDLRAGEILTGLPTDTTPTQTIHQAMDVTRGSAKQDIALNALREKNAAATNGQMNGFQSEYAHATSIASPLMYEYWSLPKEEQAQFLKRNSSSPPQAQDLRNRYEAARKQLNVGQ